MLADPLLAAATPILRLLGSLSASHPPADIRALREQAGREIALFEKTCRQGGVAMELLRPCHYALCAALDDAVLHTSWGARSAWSERPLTLTRYRELPDDAQFFGMLAGMRQEPARFLPALELFYLCLSFGFLGRYRDDPREWELIRGDLSALIVRQRGHAGMVRTVRFGALLRHFGAVPAWMSLLGAALVIGGLFASISRELTLASNAVYEAAVNAPPARMPTIAHPIATKTGASAADTALSAVTNRLKEALRSEIELKLLAVSDSPSAPLIRIPADTAFAPNSAHLRPGLEPLLERIGTVLRGQPVAVQVIAYMDTTPGRAGPFASREQLSQARAEAIRSALLRGFDDDGRISAAGRTEVDPIASNATPDAWQQNRRIDIVLRPGG